MFLQSKHEYRCLWSKFADKKTLDKKGSVLGQTNFCKLIFFAKHLKVTKSRQMCFWPNNKMSECLDFKLRLKID